MMKLRSIKFCRSNSRKLAAASGGATANNGAAVEPTNKGGKIEWEVRPGGMLVQKREYCGENINAEEIITLRVSTVSKCHRISIQATSTFGKLKMLISLMTGLDPKEQRLLYKGKEREDYEYLHMVGIRDKDKVLLLEDPAIKERKLLLGSVAVGASYRTITV